MKTQTKTLCTLLLILVAQLPAQSVPEYINYQGLLKAADGSPLATGNYNFEFNIYDQANEGARVWGPFLFDGVASVGHGPVVPVANGSFNVIIGPKDTEGDSITNAFTGPNRFIEIKVNGGSPILPRQQFLSTAYAIQSQSVQLAKELLDALCPPGSILAFGGTNVPDGWLLCDGRPLTNSMFPRLYAAISTNWGNGTLDSNGNAENPPNPDTGFNLPDLRGMFLRGMNGSLTNAGWTDPESAARVNRYGGNTGNRVGSIQAAQFPLHNHIWGETTSGGVFYTRLRSWTTPTATGSFDILYPFVASGAGSFSDDDTFGVLQQNATLYTKPDSTEYRSGEVRPNNAYVNYIIKY